MQGRRHSFGLGRLEWQPATAAAGFAQEFYLGPAIRTEAVDILHYRSAARATRRKCKVENRARTGSDHICDHAALVAWTTTSHKRFVPDLFDMKLRALRRDRAARMGAELFLFDRAFDDCIDRLSLMQCRFGKALLIGCPDPGWRERLREFADQIDVRDPGELFAHKAGGEQLVEDAWEPAPQAYDLIVAVGTLDTVNDLPRALIALRFALREGALLLGAISGGDTMTRLRSAMRAADVAAGVAAPHVHPRIEASALALLLSNAGFVNPVVDVDRVAVSYRSLKQLVTDLRRMAATNILIARPHSPLLKSAYSAASSDFSAAGDGERTTETFEILHFACWTPASQDHKHR